MHVNLGLGSGELTYSYFVTAIGRYPINCSSTELVTVQPPLGMTCGAYMGPYMSYAGGYLTNPDATLACRFCPFATTDQVMMLSYNIEYGHHWRDLGIMLGSVVFNVSGILWDENWD
jgi:ATP-binding cassette subfamily G (WHITE) protein 2 (SNQ2)